MRITNLNLKLAVALTDFAGYFTTGEDFKVTWQAILDAFMTVINPAITTAIGRTNYILASDVSTTGQVLTDATGLSFVAAANSVYEFEAVLKSLTSADANGLRFAVASTDGAATIAANAQGVAVGTTSGDNSIVAFGSSIGTVFNTTPSAMGCVLIKGFIQTSTNPSTISIQHRKEVSGTSIVQAGSILKVRKVA